MDYKFIGDVKHTSVSEEIVTLSGRHTGLMVKYIQSEDDPDRADVLLSSNTDDVSEGAFWEEFNRLDCLILRPLNEPILPDDHPVHQGYLYVVNDGRLVEFIDGERMTVGLWKQLRIEGVDPVHTVRLPDLIGRAARRPLKVKVEVNSGQLVIKPTKKRKTHKIKKVM